MSYAVEAANKMRTEAAAHPSTGLAKTFATLANFVEQRDQVGIGSIIAYTDNTLSRKLWTEATGVALPKTQKGSREAIKKWCEQ